MACLLTNHAKILIAFISISLGSMAQTDVSNMPWHAVATDMPSEWYATTQAVAIADTVVKYQMDCGGWMKNIGFHNHRPEEKFQNFDPAAVGATIDNNATMLEMRFLANVYTNHKDEKYRNAFLRGFEYILTAQYDNGGWPQFYPPRPGKSLKYSACITYNDNAIVNVMKMLREIADGKMPMEITDADRQRAQQAFDRGIENILDCQIRRDGKPTVWCAQHDEVTLQPAKARAYELPSYSGMESVGIVELLMSVPNPSAQVIAAVDGAMEWFEQNKISDMDFVRFYDADGRHDGRLESTPGHDIWARFYDLETGQPFFCDRDGIKHPSVYDIGQERRGGYQWYTDMPSRLFPKYQKWKAKLQRKQSKQKI